MVWLVLSYHYNGTGQRPRHCHGRSHTADGMSDPLCYRDLRAGRYPLHYAAGRVGYVATFPVGISCGVQVLRETSPIHDILPLFPEACRATDGAGQLPLHITIDAFKKNRAATELSPPATQQQASPRSAAACDADETEEDKVLQLLLSHYPAALNQRDGKTKLFPWQQAAVGSGARLTTMYQLLRANPTLFTTTQSLESGRL